MSSVMAADLNETGNFTELGALISDTDDNVNLTSDYGYVDGDEDVVISKSVKISGNDHIINNSDSPIIIDANDSSVYFEDVNFLSSEFEISNNTNLNVTFFNCSFKSSCNDSCVDIYLDRYYGLNTTGEISSNITALAKSIVGDSKGYDAAYKLAMWVWSNIKHETRAGFYQSPDTTVERKLGNCCCHSDLFLQMCIAVGVNEDHKLYLVHVGNMAFGYRHFFVMIDNLLIDTDIKSRNPWGYAYFGNRDIFRITEYPYLPIMKDY